MPNHRELLQRTTARDLRAITTRLQTGRANATRSERVDAVALFWAQRAIAELTVRQLSPLAQEALRRLAAATHFPSALFFGEYGPVRPAQKRYPRGQAPWRQPLTPAEELFYAGLLFPETGRTLAKSRNVIFPDDLGALAGMAMSLLPATTESAEQLATCTGDGMQAAAALVHDLAQLLIVLHTQYALNPAAGLLYGRWLRPSVLSALHPRLLAPDDVSLPRSHRQSLRLRLLMFLATTLGLHKDGVITPVGWEWLDAQDAFRYRILWRGYVSADAALRSTYLLPDAGLPVPWPTYLATVLVQMPAAFQPAALADALLHAQADAPLYWSLHVPNLSALRDLVVSLVREVLVPLGVAAVIEGTDGRPMTIQLTAQGCALLNDDLVAGWTTDPVPAVLRSENSDYTVTLARVDAAAARLAPYVAWQTVATGHGPPQHTLRLSADTVRKAALQGCPLPPLLDALHATGAELAAEDRRCLAAWHGAVGRVDIGLWPLLRTNSSAHMQALMETPAVARLVGELLAPTIAVLARDPNSVAEQLRARGWYVADGKELEHGEQSSRSLERNREQGRVPAVPANRSVALSREARIPTAEYPAVWLAGQLYRTLASHLALPLPSPAASLDAIFAHLDPAAQAALRALWSRIEQDFLAFLDGVTPFVPPVVEDDGACWRAIIEDSIVQRRQLELVYFSPARNLLTRRVVEPYHLVTRRGVTYMHAYCLDRDRVLTFRLDRIRGLSYTTE